MDLECDTMTTFCPGCHTKVKWYHKKGGNGNPCNTSWHRACARSFDVGYSICDNFSCHIYRDYGLPDWHELYNFQRQYPTMTEIIVKFNNVQYRKEDI